MSELVDGFSVVLSEDLVGFFINLISIFLIEDVVR